ncbi:MAG: bifunctional oligoribonuclease/PAP phosphatase NrnA [Desulfovibrionales bacterium]|nr:MAG: bifunctional oligoribonuclease/PAP phosphatase NrnA [Desulfovibrionales bacterium]
MTAAMKADTANSWARVLRLLREGDHFLVAGHNNPDGDALGSTVALGWLLESLGKNYCLFNESPVPDRFSWLRSPRPLQQVLPDWEPKWYVLLDCGDAKRVGKDLAGRLPLERTINIDHHVSNRDFGVVNLVEPDRSSVGEMIGYLAQELGIPLVGPLGEAVYLALITDTGSFSYENTGPKVLELAATIIRNGLNPGRFNALLQNQWRLNRLKLMGDVLRGAKIYDDGRIGLVSIPAAFREANQATIEDCDDMVDYIRRVKGVRIAVSLREDEPRKIKFSLRSSGNTDVEEIASSVGGGGHKNASGGELHHTLQDAEVLLVRLIRQYLALADKNPSSMG